MPRRSCQGIELLPIFHQSGLPVAACQNESISLDKADKNKAQNGDDDKGFQQSEAGRGPPVAAWPDFHAVAETGYGVMSVVPQWGCSKPESSEPAGI